MPLPLMLIPAIVTAGCAVVGATVTTVKAVSSYNLDPRVAARKQQKDLAYMQKCQEELKKNQAKYDAGRIKEKTYQYYDRMYRRQIEWMHERMQARAVMYQPVQAPPDPPQYSA